MARRQDRVFDRETPPAGFAFFHVNASCTIVTKRAAHIFSIKGYNIGDKLYRNHLTFIKEIAREIGLSVRLNCSLRF
jgi:iron complex outermembrane receptor protein